MNLESVEKLIPDENRKLVFQFFLVFSRFEFALKRAGFLVKKEKKNDEAIPAWDDFGKAHDAAFHQLLFKSQPQALQAAIDYFTKTPPLKQIQKDGVLDWSKSKPYDNHEALLKWLLCMVRRVRNNLFHGGKFPFASVPEPARDINLLQHALTILDVCVPLDAKVAQFFAKNE